MALRLLSYMVSIWGRSFGRRCRRSVSFLASLSIIGFDPSSIGCETSDGAMLGSPTWKGGRRHDPSSTSGWSRVGGGVLVRRVGKLDRRLVLDPGQPKHDFIPSHVDYLDLGGPDERPLSGFAGEGEDGRPVPRGSEAR